MPDYVFNDASITPPLPISDDARSQLIELLVALAALDDGSDVLPSFRSSRDPWVLQVTSEANGNPITLGALAHELYGSQHHDAASYFDSLIRLSPADSNMSENEVEAVLRLNPMTPHPAYPATFPSVQAAPIEAGICAVIDDLLVSLLSNPLWDCDLLGFISEAREFTVDHVATIRHAHSVKRRRVAALRAGLTAKTFWSLRAQVFPNLLFAPSVEKDLDKFSATLLPLLFSRLADLDSMADNWTRTHNFPASPLRLKPETPETMKNYGLQRRFRGVGGALLTFEEHVWVDSLHRVHVFRHTAHRRLEVGYIGRHLSTMNYPS